MEQELIQIFQAMTVLHERFNEQAVRKEEVIKTGDMQGLEQVMKDESPLIQHLRKLENTRQHLVQEWMKEKGLVKENVTMEQLTPLFPEKDREDLLYWQQRLMTEIQKLKEQNNLNQQLLEDSLRFVNLSLDAMNPQNQFTSYSGAGEKEDDDEIDPGGRSLFDSKV
ncbi:flagellar protein FlgN [Salipaludibacillus daqingensis]|uniref:flagellar protein FlgN n=1 Tax=Salipaludibacillus daqingensis TaxID=3041001 RepID=UPI0024755886|nr:flagellar protein FlgN [Salipaludibacillus daqingensis]